MKTHSELMPTNKSFGLFFSALFFCISAYYFWKENIHVSLGLLILGLTFFISATLFPNLLGALNKLWFKIGLLLGAIVSPLVLSAIFFIMFTPLALFFRLTGRDALLIKRREISSYWINRSDRTSSSYDNQF
jgi:hypothetical protein